MKEKPIAFYPSLARELGDVASALFYQQLYFWSDKGDREDGFIYKSKEEIESETTLSRDQQDRIRKKLVEIGWLEVKLTHNKNGKPTLHFKCLVDIQVSISGKPTNGNSGKPTNECVGNPPMLYTENTTENTSDEKSSQNIPPKPLKGKMKVSPLNPAHNTLRPLVIKALEPLHPLEAKRWYANTTEGKAVDALIDWLGEKKLMRFAEVWPTAVKEAFAPQAYKPSAILAKWPQIEKYLIERKKSGNGPAPQGGEATMGRLAEMLG